MLDQTALRRMGLLPFGPVRTRPVYRHISRAIERGIDTGTLTRDARLPAERELARARARLRRPRDLRVGRTRPVRGPVCLARQGRVGRAAGRRFVDPRSHQQLDRSGVDVGGRRRSRPRVLSRAGVPAGDRSHSAAARARRLGTRRNRRTSRVPRRDRAPLRRASRQRARPGRCAAGPRPAGALSHRTRRHGRRRSAGLSRRHSHLSRGRRAAGRLGRRAARSRRARGPARQVQAEAHLHESHVPEPHGVDDGGQAQAGVAGSRSQIPRPHHRGRHLPRAAPGQPAPALDARAGSAPDRHSPEQLLEDPRARPAPRLADGFRRTCASTARRITADRWQDTEVAGNPKD